MRVPPAIIDDVIEEEKVSERRRQGCQSSAGENRTMENLCDTILNMRIVLKGEERNYVC